ncbi:SMN domain-containing protein [Trichophyton interdigitale]|nr:SMN domain-containing protein [Trichophyton interdigitale]KAG5217319.1 SMN domain-containing protein [Trichophyton interdigitale]KAG8205790.1 SMN domain-containing protein [Trichophyton interdigitale]
MKKRKRSSRNKTLTQEEIWDDSALLESWEEAAEEYRLYHSIQARGQKVEDVLREAEAEASNAIEDEMQIETNAETENPSENMTVDVSETVAVEESDGKIKQVDICTTSQVEDEAAPESTAEAEKADTAAPASANLANMPQLVLNGAPNPPNIQDEGLKNLMMSWYFAGYYTGLYEGQRQAAAKQ